MDDRDEPEDGRTKSLYQWFTDYFDSQLINLIELDLIAGGVIWTAAEHNAIIHKWDDASGLNDRNTLTNPPD